MAIQLLNWETFRVGYLDTGVPASVNLVTNPNVTLSVEAGGRGLSIRGAVGPESPRPVSPLRQVTIGTRRVRGLEVLEVSTQTSELFREFFHFTAGVADLVANGGLSLPEAIDKALASWRSLLQSAARLDRSAEVGLFGELVILSRVGARGWTQAMSSWIGPQMEPHDFRMGSVEYEVKTTTGATRSHMIHGLGQLQPSKGRKLCLISVQLEPAGAGPGETLPEKAAKLAASMPAELRPEFSRILEDHFHLSLQDNHLYPERFTLRAPLYVVPVVAKFPRITTRILEGSLDKAVVGLVSEVSYRVNVEGLGVLEGSPGFSRLFGY